MALHLRLKQVIITLLFLLAIIISYGQIDLSRDTVSNENGMARNQRFRSDFDGGKQTPSVYFKIDKLNKLLQACTAAGQSQVEMVFSTLRREDTASYIRTRNLQLTTPERNMLLNRPIVLIKVPRQTLDYISAAKKYGFSQNITALLALRFINWNQLVNAWQEDIYFDFGVVCPPPSNCN